MIIMEFSQDLSDKLSLEYPDDVPNDYDVSQIQFTYDFIYSVLKDNSAIADAVRIVSRKYDLSEGYLNDYLIENKYVLDKTNKNEFAKELKKYNTKSLKRILKKHGVKASGKREKIEKRILDYNLLGNSYRLSSKSKIFYKNKKRRVRIFDKYLTDHYYFREFNEFYMDNYRKKEGKIPIEFIKRHISKSIRDKDHTKFTINNHIMAQHYCKKENYKKMLGYALKNYCINLNPVWKIDDLKKHGGPSLQDYNMLLFLNDKIGKNRIISAYSAVWNSFNFEKIIVSKYAGYIYLKKILNGYDYHKIIQDLENNFYSNEDIKIKKITQKTLFDF